MKTINAEEVYRRKLVTLFPDEKIREGAVSILNEYGAEKHERESVRVRLAILKISGGDLEQIRQSTDLAKQDYRDVLIAAEYPNQGSARQVPKGPEKLKLIEKDRQQYENWLSAD